MSTAYDTRFYTRQVKESGYTQTEILRDLFNVLGYVPRTAIDIGCGIGNWLHYAKQQGVQNVLGLDGDWVQPSQLVLAEGEFSSADLKTLVRTTPIVTADLAICLEVAEHLPEECAIPLVRYLCDAAPVVLFSAAIPGQGGTNHINEQWQHYWVDLFRQNGYYVGDFIRPFFWTDRKIPFWYRQNMFVFSKKPIDVDISPLPVDIVHPVCLQINGKKRRKRS